MKVALAAVIVFLVPGVVMGQPSELRLNCIVQEVSLFNVNKNTTEKISEGDGSSFSAVVRMGAMNNGTGSASIEVHSLAPCQIYEGSFDNLKVSGSCEKMAGYRLKGILNIDRTNGTFHHTIQTQKIEEPNLVLPNLIFSGQCKPAEKLF